MCRARLRRAPEDSARRSRALHKTDPRKSALTDFQQVRFPRARVDGLLRIIDSRIVDEHAPLRHEALGLLVRRREPRGDDDLRQKLRLFRRRKTLLIDFTRRLTIAENAAKLFVRLLRRLRAMKISDDNTC